MKIKLKVKHIVYFTAVVILFIVLIPKITYIAAKLTSKKSPEISKVFYKKYSQIAYTKEEKAKALFLLAEQIAPHENLMSEYRILRNGSGSSGELITYEVALNAANYYKQIYDNHSESDYYSKAYKRLVDIYTRTSEIEKGKNLIKEGLNSDNKEVNFIALKYNISYLMVSNEINKAKGYAEKLLKEYEDDVDVYYMMGDICFKEHDYEKAQRYYKEGKELEHRLANSNLTWKECHDLRMYPILTSNPEQYNFDRMDLVSNIKNIYKGQGGFKGRVIINGSPVPFTKIYLKDSRWDNLGAWHSIDSGYYTVTDLNGNYKIDNLPEGEYVVEIGVPMVLLSKNETIYQDSHKYGWIKLRNNEIKEENFIFSKPLKILKPKGEVKPVDGSVEVEWEKVEGAAYYQVKISVSENYKDFTGGICTFCISPKIKGERYTIDIEQINDKRYGFSMNDKGYYNPQVYLGTLIPGSKIPIIVEAYDENDKTIKASNAILKKYKDLSMISIEEKGLNEGDKLILDKKTKEALNWYNSYLTKNPNDIKTLKILCKLYTMGTREDTEEHKGVDNDFNKALKLAEKIKDLTGDYYFIKYVLNNYSSFKDIQFEHVINKIELLPEKELSEDEYCSLARIQLKLKNYKKADEYFDKQNELSESYIPDDAVLTKIYLDDIDGAVKLAKNNKYSMYSGNKEEFIYYLEKIKTDKISELDSINLKKYIKLILDRKKDYKKTCIELEKSIKESILKGILNEIKKECYIDQD